MRTRSRISPRPRRASREPVVPMINVVFLLLIFFLMTAQIVPPAPFDVRLPSAEGNADAGDTSLYIDADGRIAFQALRGDAALTAAANTARDDTLRIHADAELTATVLARVLSQLTVLGASQVDIVTEGR